MRSIALTCSAAAVWLTGCAARPVVSVDLRYLDAAPVVMVQTETGTCSGLLLEDGRLVTCSHGLARGKPSGDLCVMGVWTTYTVEASGDGLKREWGGWKGTVPEGIRDDWSRVRLEPAVKPEAIFHPTLRVTAGPRPIVGETLYAVGYTVEPAPAEPPLAARNEAVRHWVPLVVIEPPTSGLARTGEPVTWLRTGPEDSEYLSRFASASPLSGAGRPAAFIAPGFSGAPILRFAGLDSSGLPKFEYCGILVAGDRGLGDEHGSYALAIPPPAGEAPK